MSAEHDDRLDGILPSWTQKEVLPLLMKVLPERAIISSPEGLRPYECDGLSVYKVQPLVVVLPENKEQVLALVKLCFEQVIPIVPRGAGTGLSGGALPLNSGILLSLARMNQILSIDPVKRFACVQAGVRNLAISEAVSVHNLYYAPDPSSQIACSIGGNVAENAGGVHCLKYGLTVNNIQRIECVLADGTLVEIGDDCLERPGLDLLALLHGSEGMLAIITEVTVRLLAKPDAVKTLLVSFDDVQVAGQAVADVIAAGVIPAGLEMMDKLAIQAAEDFAHAGYPRDAEAILLCELDGCQDDVAEELECVIAVFNKSGATEVRVAQSDRERAKFWLGRKSAFPAVGRLSPDYYCMDGTIPRRALPTILQGISDLSTQFHLRVANVFHAGDGNLHPLILYDANVPGELEKAERMGGEILELCVKVGGTITGEHGVGREKINQMCVQFSAEELTQFHRTKEAFDPKRILNPNKNIPTLTRCAEFGAMHVHHGELPFPDLERF
jgi:glycolate oxidase